MSVTISTRTKAPGLSPDSPSTATVTLTVPVAGSTAGAMRSMIALRGSTGRISRQPHLLAWSQPGHVALGDVDVGVERIEISQVKNRGAIGDRGADIEVAGHNDTRDRRPDDRAVELELGELEGVGRILGIATARLVLVDAHQPPVVETRQAFVVATCGLLGRAGTGGGDLLLLVLEIGKGLLGPDPIALFDRKTPNDSAGTSDDRRLPVGAKGCGGRIKGGNGLTNNLAGAHRDRRFFFFALSVFPVPVRPVSVGLIAAAGDENRHEEAKSTLALSTHRDLDLAWIISILSFVIADWSGSLRMPRGLYGKSAWELRYSLFRSRSRSRSHMAHQSEPR